MATKTLIQIPTGTSVLITNSLYFVATRDNGDGTSTDYRFSTAELIAAILLLVKKEITVGVAGSTLTDSWFSGKTVALLITNGQAYQAGVNFTQSGDTITGIDISFYNGQKVIAQL